MKFLFLIRIDPKATDKFEYIDVFLEKKRKIFKSITNVNEDEQCSICWNIF